MDSGSRKGQDLPDQFNGLERIQEQPMRIKVKYQPPIQKETKSEVFGDINYDIMFDRAVREDMAMLSTQSTEDKMESELLISFSAYVKIIEYLTSRGSLEERLAILDQLEF